MQGKLKGTRPNNQQFLHEFAKNLPVNSKENCTVQDWVYFIDVGIMDSSVIRSFPSIMTIW